MPSSHGRHLQKSVYGNTSCKKLGDGEDKARIEEAEKAAMVAETDTTQGQQPP